MISSPISFFSCPFDYMTIYDGEDNFSEKIGTYCGQLRNLVIFSTNNKLFVTFTTLKRTAPVQNRGFSGLYEFSEDFVRLGMLLISILNRVSKDDYFCSKQTWNLIEFDLTNQTE